MFANTTCLRFDIFLRYMYIYIYRRKLLSIYNETNDTQTPFIFWSPRFINKLGERHAHAREIESEGEKERERREGDKTNLLMPGKYFYIEIFS